MIMRSKDDLTVRPATMHPLAEADLREQVYQIRRARAKGPLVGTAAPWVVQCIPIRQMLRSRAY